MNNNAYFCIKTSDKKAATKLINFLSNLDVEPKSTSLIYAESLEGLADLIDDLRKKVDGTKLPQVQQTI